MIILGIRLRSFFDWSTRARRLSLLRFAWLPPVFVSLLCSVPFGSFAVPQDLSSKNSLTWKTNSNLVSADLHDADLLKVLQKVSAATGWKIYLEPGTSRTVSAKFTDLAPGNAMHMLLGDINFALVPETNNHPKLFVFRTGIKNATQLVVVAKAKEVKDAHGKLIPNELIVRLKPGAKIDELAKSLGATVIGKIDSLNAYRLKFDDEAAATAAREQLSGNPDVTSVDSNYSLDRPANPQEVLSSNNLPGPPQLRLNPPTGSDKIVVGLVDTAVQPLGHNLDQFLLKAISAAGDAELDPTVPSHGTAMAETMLRSLQSITQGSTSVQILPVDVYGPNESTSTFEVANGIVMAVNQGANPINLSLGSDSDSAFLRQIIAEASAKNILFIASAGNQPVTTPFYPAAYPGVTAVTAVDNGQLASYANRGSFVSLGAPGTSLIYFGNQAFVVQGTSPSAAFTSGLLAGYADKNHATLQSADTFVLRALNLQKVLGK
jgi:hypothetical protein